MDEHGLDKWWAQTITVGYEQAWGLREPGQNPDGSHVSASKTVSGTTPTPTPGPGLR
jgi:hypothetical protein